MIPDKWDLLNVAGCDELTDEAYDRHWEYIRMTTCVSMKVSGKRWASFGSCGIPYQLGGNHHAAYWIQVTTEEGNNELLLFDDSHDATEAAQKVNYEFYSSVHTYMWGWN